MEHEDSSEILNAYATYLADARGAAPSTARAYTAAARELLELVQARSGALLLPPEASLEAIDKRALEIHLHHLRDARGWRASTLAAHLRGLRSFFGWLHSAGHVQRDPTRGLRVDSPRAARSLPDGDESRVRDLFQAPRAGLTGARAMLLLELIYGGGLRPAQAYAVRAFEPDPARGVARVETGSGAVEIPLTPGGLSRAEAYLSARAAAMLEKPARETAANDPRNAPFWIGTGCRAVGAAALARQVRIAMERAGLNGGAAVLRQLAARHFRARGADIRSLRQFLGARRLTGLRRYDPLAPDGDAQALRRISDQLKKAHPRREPV